MSFLFFSWASSTMRVCWRLYIRESDQITLRLSRPSAPYDWCRNINRDIIFCLKKVHSTNMKVFISWHLCKSRLYPKEKCKMGENESDTFAAGFFRTWKFRTRQLIDSKEHLQKLKFTWFWRRKTSKSSCKCKFRIKPWKILERRLAAPHRRLRLSKVGSGGLVALRWELIFTDSLPGVINIQRSSPNNLDCVNMLGKPPSNSCSRHLGIAHKGGGLNPCPDGLGQFFWEEFAWFWGGPETLPGWFGALF